MNTLDRKTELIIGGYIRKIKYLLISSPSNTLYHTIPSTVINIITIYIDDHFMFTKSTFIWNATEFYPMNNILSSLRGAKIQSIPFEVGKLSWLVYAYPNGLRSVDLGQFIIYVKLLKMPPNWKSITIYRSIHCLQTESRYIELTEYDTAKSVGTPNGLLPLQEIRELELEKLTFIITIKILKITLKKENIIFYHCKLNNYNKPKHFEWKVNGKLLEKFKTANVGKICSSDIFDEMWCFTVYFFV